MRPLAAALALVSVVFAACNDDGVVVTPPPTVIAVNCAISRLDPLAPIPVGGVFNTRVLATADGKPAAGATLTLAYTPAAPANAPTQITTGTDGIGAVSFAPTAATTARVTYGDPKCASPASVDIAATVHAIVSRIAFSQPAAGARAVAGATVPVTVTLLDGAGAPVPNAAVGFEIGAGGGTVSSASAATDAQGTATTQLTTGKTVGTNQVCAVHSPTGFPPIRFCFGLPTDPGAASQVLPALPWTPPSIEVGTTISPLPAVTVSDANGNPVPNQGVVWRAGALTVTVLPVNFTNASGVSTLPITTVPIDIGAGTFSATVVDGAGKPLLAAPATFGYTATPPTAADLSLTPASQTLPVGTAADVVVTVKSSAGIPVPNAKVTLTEGQTNFGDFTTDATGKVRVSFGSSAFPTTRTFTLTTRGQTFGSVTPLYRMDATVTWTAAQLVATFIAVGSNHGGAILPNGQVALWGSSLLGEIFGVPAGTDALVPKLFSAPNGSPIVGLALGYQSSCVAMQNGTVGCTGYNQFGQHGDGGTTTGGFTLAQTPAEGLKSIVGNRTTYCAFGRTSKSLYCWGAGGSRQNGSAAGANLLVPTVVAAPAGVTWMAADYTAATSDVTTCALDVTGQAYCFGSSQFGQRGDGSTAIASGATPAAILGTHPPFVQIAGGLNHFIALGNDGSLWGWGRNDSGQLGTGGVTNVATPQRVAPSMTFQSIAWPAGGFNSCAIASNGQLYCSGQNPGALATGNTTPSLVFVPAAGGRAFAAAASNGGMTCVRDATGLTWCSGPYPTGDGTNSGALTLTPVKSGVP